MTALFTLSRRSLDELEAAIVAHAQRINAAEYAFLELVREFDIRQGWKAYQFNNCAEWLNMKCGIVVGTAREKVRVASALFDLPEISRAFASGAAFNDAFHADLANHDVDLVALLGFLSLFELRGRYAGRTLNVHPSLLPAFGGQGCYGHRVYEALLAAGVKLTGASVHFADDAYDRGPILLQEAVPVLEDDDVESLAARVTAAERRLVPEAIRLFAEGRVRIVGNRTVIDRSQPPGAER